MVSSQRKTHYTNISGGQKAIKEHRILKLVRRLRLPTEVTATGVG